jgi:DeoR-like helix-turn-helix domain
MKTNKHQTLLLVRTNGHVEAKDLVRQFGYSPGTARSYLSYLKRQDLLARTGQGHVFTERGWDRLQYFNVAGCGHPACPLCDKKAGYFTCSRCGYQLPTKEAQILPERDFLQVYRHAGVYCPRCLKLLFTEPQAQLLKIPKAAR